MHPVRVVVVDALTTKAPQVLLVDHGHMVEQLTAERPNPALSDSAGSPTLPDDTPGPNWR